MCSPTTARWLQIWWRMVLTVCGKPSRSWSSETVMDPTQTPQSVASPVHPMMVMWLVTGGIIARPSECPTASVLRCTSRGEWWALRPSHAPGNTCSSVCSFGSRPGTASQSPEDAIYCLCQSSRRFWVEALPLPPGRPLSPVVQTTHVSENP